MNWKQLLADRLIQRHTASNDELYDIREVVKRDLRDAALPGLSADRRFATAYNAVLQLARLAIACAGYRVSLGPAHHRTTFDAVKLALGKGSTPLIAYFDTCRRKRNIIDYDQAEVATETEAAELLKKAKEFRGAVEAWVRDNHPGYRS